MKGGGTGDDERGSLELRGGEGKANNFSFAIATVSLFVRFSLFLSLHKVALLKMECGLPEMLLCR